MARNTYGRDNAEDNGWRERDNERGTRFYQDYDWETPSQRGRSTGSDYAYGRDYDYDRGYSTPYRGEGYDRRYARRDFDQGRRGSRYFNRDYERRYVGGDYERGRRFASPYDYNSGRSGGEGDWDYLYGYRDDSTYDFDRGAGTNDMRYGGYAGGQMERRGERGRRGRYTGRGPQGYKRSDERIQEDVNETLMAHGDIDAWNINVRVENGEVTLEGTVEDRWQKRLAEDAVEEVSGVNQVHNRLRVEQQSQNDNNWQSRQMGESGETSNQSSNRTRQTTSS